MDNTGGSAFPECGVWDGDRNQVNPVGAYFDAGGMTLLDYFAAKALEALIAKDNKDGENRGKKAVPIMAAFAYEYADAMIAERAKRQGGSHG